MTFPETVTPWLVLGTTFLAFVAGLGAAGVWLWRKLLWPAFRAGVMDAAAPLQDALERLADAIERTARVEAQLIGRTNEADTKLSDISSRLRMLEVRQSRDTQRVVTAVQEAASPPVVPDAP